MLLAVHWVRRTAISAQLRELCGQAGAVKTPLILRTTLCLLALPDLSPARSGLAPRYLSHQCNPALCSLAA